MEKMNKKGQLGCSRISKKSQVRGSKISKKSQVTIFIILGIAIVIVLILLFTGQDNFPSLSGEPPVDKIIGCIRDSSQGGLSEIMSQGGSLNPELYYNYEGEEIEYLCYAEEDYEQCVMQRPLLKQHIEGELEKYVQPKARECINNFRGDLENEGYSVSSSNPDVNIELVPEAVLIGVEAGLIAEKEDIREYKTIKTDLSSNLYKMVMITTSILNWEARYGDSEIMAYMTYYPSIKVEKKRQGDGSKIYILSDEDEKFMFATRSMVIPAGVIL